MPGRRRNNVQDPVSEENTAPEAPKAISDSLNDAMLSSLTSSPAPLTAGSPESVDNNINLANTDAADQALLDQQLTVTHTLKDLLKELRDNMLLHAEMGISFTESIKERLAVFHREFDTLESLPLPGHDIPYNQMGQMDTTNVANSSAVIEAPRSTTPIINPPQQATSSIIPVRDEPPHKNDNFAQNIAREKIRREQEEWQQAEARAKLAKMEAFGREFEARTGKKFIRPDVLREEPYFLHAGPPFNVPMPNYNVPVSPISPSPASGIIPPRLMTHIPSSGNVLPSADLPAPLAKSFPTKRTDEQVIISKNLLDQIQSALNSDPVVAKNAFITPDDKSGKMNPPAPFNGSAEDVLRFLLDVHNHFVFSPSVFHSDAKKIQFALSFCKEGIPAKWKTQCLWEIISGTFRYNTWEDFSNYFLATFGNLQPEHEARQKLYDLRQGDDQTARSFFIEVDVGMRAAGITDQKQIIVHLMDDMLHKVLTNAILDLGVDLNNFEAFRDRVINIDANLRLKKPNPFFASKRQYNKSSISRAPLASTSASSSNVELMCSFCNRKGHIEENCWKKEKVENQGENKKPKPKSDRLRIMGELMEGMDDEEKELFFRMKESAAEDFSSAEE
ncbi:hypothetical protein CVT24_000323 [Panaeolus cyanescens]|uniref:Retrotransposon gag domain-containing protein n=1 Tax=Panaeolus cyanescens TaxID=181874 RepID=A0A409YCZ6_9AGAR|nr:hypothetical protein CVT24_000323 [Panaeolus cyanescens]